MENNFKNFHPTPVESGMNVKSEITFKTLDVSDERSFLDMIGLIQGTWSYLMKPEEVDKVRKRIKSGDVVMSAIYKGDKVIATALVLIKADPKNFMLKELPNESLYAYGAVVDPAFRGRGLQKILLEKRVDLVRHLKKETLLGCVRPENGASVRNITNTGGRILAYSPKFFRKSENSTRLVWEIDNTLLNEKQEQINKSDALTPDAALEALKRGEKEITLLIKSDNGEEGKEEIDIEAQKVIAKILSAEYVGTTTETLSINSAGFRINGMVFKHLSTFPPETEKRLRERKKKIQNIL